MRTSWKTELPQLAIIAGLFAWSIYLWPIAPESLPVHFDLSGHVDRMGSKFEGLFAVPTVALVLYLVLRFLPRLDPARENYASFAGAYAYVLATTTPFYGAVLTEAVGRTFERRGTSLDAGSTVMTDGFARDANRQSSWAGYLRKERIDTVPDSFESVMPVILDFVGPPFRAAGDGSSFRREWDPESRRWR